MKKNLMEEGLLRVLFEGIGRYFRFGKYQVKLT